MALDERWFTEPCEECGSAFSLRIKEKLHEEKTAYQRIEVYATDTFGNLMTIDGFVMLTDRDNFVYHEMMSHPALFTHVEPKKVVIIGGGDCGTLREVLKHPGVGEAWQVEIDERVTRVSEQYFPRLCESNADPRARFHFGDGIQWVKDAEPGSVDVIIIDSTDPIGPAEGLFSEPFYRDCLKALGSGGILVQQSESPLFHMRIIKPMHKAMRSAGFHDSKSLHFFQCSYPSGWWTATMARKGTAIDGFRDADVRARGFETLYYNADMHRASLAAPEFFRRELENL
ncbi:MAG: polyamine aminopropyltransferase [Gammaproteobacteria bacterium]